MCDLDSVSGLITAAEVAAVVVLAALAIAVVLRGNLYTAFASTVPMVAALIAVTSAHAVWRSLFAMVTENMFDNRVPFWMHSNVSPRTLLYAALLMIRNP